MNDSDTAPSSREEFLTTFNVSRETIERLDIYADLLTKWQKRINLVGPSTIEPLWMRHFGDSLELLEHLPQPTERWLDIGTGAGFPGLVMAICGFSEGVSVNLVESNAKKCAFLREVARRTNVLATVHNQRIESIDSQAIQDMKPEIVSARALASLELLLDLAEKPLAQGAIGVFPRGQDVDGELTRCAKYWNIEAEVKMRAYDLPGKVLIVHKCTRK